MNELLSLAVAVFKFTSRYSERKMPSTASSVGPIRTVRKKKMSSPAVPPRVHNAGRDSPGSKTRKTASVSADREVVQAMCGGGAKSTFPEASPAGRAVSDTVHAQGPLPQLTADAAVDGLSDSSEEGPKEKLKWLFELDPVPSDSNCRSVARGAPAVRSQALSCHAALQPCEGQLTRPESARSASRSLNHSRLESVRYRRRVVDNCLEEDCRTSVEACLAQCAPSFQNTSHHDGGSCHLDPLDGVVFHRFMVNSQGDLFDYDLQNPQPDRTGSSSIQEVFPAAAHPRPTERRTQGGSGLCRTRLDAFAEGHEICAGYRERQVKALKEECQVLRVEKEVAVERWKKGCLELNQALDTILTLRVAVDKLIGAKLRNSSRRCVHCPSKPVKGPWQGETSQQSSGLYESSISHDPVNPVGKLKDAKALEDRFEKPRGGRSSRSELYLSDSRVPRSDVIRRKSEERLELTRTSTTLSLVNTMLSAWLDHSDREKRRVATSTDMDSGHTTIDWTAKNQSSQETIPASPYLAHSRERRDYGVSGKDNRSRELAITAIRGIVEQFQAEGELWSQVQEVLHNVSYDMENLVVACAEWEDRALHAEALSSSLENKASEWKSKAERAEQQICDLQRSINDLKASASRASDSLVKAEVAQQQVSDMEFRMQDLKSIAERVLEWQTRAEVAEQKVLVLESDMSHLRATLELVKGRHAIEQSRLLEAGTKLRHTGVARLSNPAESGKSSCILIPQQELEGNGHDVTNAFEAMSRNENSRSGHDKWRGKKMSKHTSGTGVHRELDAVELARFIVPHVDADDPPKHMLEDIVDAAVRVEPGAPQRTADDGMHAELSTMSYCSGRLGSAIRGKNQNGAGTSTVAIAFKSSDVESDSRHMRQPRCPPRPTNTPKLASKPKKVGVDNIISYSGPMRQCSDLDMHNRSDTWAPLHQTGNPGLDTVSLSEEIAAAKKTTSCEEVCVSVRCSDRPEAQRVPSIRRHDNSSWDADEDRSDFASRSSTDSDSTGTIESAEHEFSGWTVEMLDKWKETASSELSKVRRKFQVPSDQQSEQRGPGGRTSEASAWENDITLETVDIEAEKVTMKPHFSAEKVRAVIPTFQSLFPGRLRRKTGVKLAGQKMHTVERDMAGQNRNAVYDIGGYHGHKTHQIERESSVGRSKGSFFNGIQKQFRNSPSHSKQIVSDKCREISTSQELERKLFRDRKNDGSFLEDIRKHFTGKSLYPGKERSRSGSPFAEDHQRHFVVSSPVCSRPPLTEIMGNASEFFGGRAFYSG